MRQVMVSEYVNCNLGRWELVEKYVGTFRQFIEASVRDGNRVVYFPAVIVEKSNGVLESVALPFIRFLDCK